MAVSRQELAEPLTGHHAILEKAYLHDPAVRLNAPLRTLIYIDSADRTRLAVDQPSTVYASFADPVTTNSVAISTSGSPSCSTRLASRQARGYFRLAGFQCGADPAGIRVRA